jgi:hypothetical protein
MVNRIPDEFGTSCRLKRKTSSHLAILQKKLGFHSADELISILVDIVSRKEWSKTDLESLQRYGKIIQVMSGTARNEDEMLENLGILKEKGIKVKGKIKKKEENKK